MSDFVGSILPVTECRRYHDANEKCLYSVDFIFNFYDSRMNIQTKSISILTSVNNINKLK